MVTSIQGGHVEGRVGEKERDVTGTSGMSEAEHNRWRAARRPPRLDDFAAAMAAATQDRGGQRQAR